MWRLIGSLVFGTLGVAAVAGMLGVPPKAEPAPAAFQNESVIAALPAPAARLKVRLGSFAGAPEELLDPANKEWEAAKPTRVLLNRTPRIYQTEPSAQPRPTSLEVRALRSDKEVCLRLEWEDATHNVPAAPPRRSGDAPDPVELYKRPPGTTAAFADAAAVMAPESPAGGEFPSLVMGDELHPVRLYYWNASYGAERLKAAGRAKVERTDQTFRHQAHHEGGRWTLTLAAPDLATPTPVAFAVWDGELADRDGLKMFSIWYVME